MAVSQCEARFEEVRMDFKLLMVFVDQDRTDTVLTAAREAGATGATIINNAQGQGSSRS